MMGLVIVNMTADFVRWESATEVAEWVRIIEIPSPAPMVEPITGDAMDLASAWTFALAFSVAACIGVCCIAGIVLKCCRRRQPPVQPALSNERELNLRESKKSASFALPETEESLFDGFGVFDIGQSPHMTIDLGQELVYSDGPALEMDQDGEPTSGFDEMLDDIELSRYFDTHVPKPHSSLIVAHARPHDAVRQVPSQEGSTITPYYENDEGDQRTARSHALESSIGSEESDPAPGQEYSERGSWYERESDYEYGESQITAEHDSAYDELRELIFEYDESDATYTEALQEADEATPRCRPSPATTLLRIDRTEDTENEHPILEDHRLRPDYRSVAATAAFRGESSAEESYQDDLSTARDSRIDIELNRDHSALGERIQEASDLTEPDSEVPVDDFSAGEYYRMREVYDDVEGRTVEHVVL
jgi:hypothetical protein